MSVFKGHDDLSLNRYYYSFYSFSQDDPNTIKSFVYDQNQTLVSSKDISFNSRNIPDILSFLENSQSNPYALGKSNDEFLNMDIAFAGLYKKALTENQQQSLMTYINKTYKNVFYGTVNTFTIQVTQSVQDSAVPVFIFNGDTSVENPMVPVGTVGLYIFDQSHPSNAGFPIAFRDIQSPFAPYTNVIVEGTPGTPNSYSLVSITDISAPLNVKYYTTSTETNADSIFGELLNYLYQVKVETNILGDPVFAIQSPGQSAYVLQPDLSFNNGVLAYFYVGDDSMTDISLVFGPTVDDTANVVGSPYYVKMGDIIRLDLTSGYTDDPLVYFEDTSAGMGYMPPSGTGSYQWVQSDFRNTSVLDNWGPSNTDTYVYNYTLTGNTDYTFANGTYDISQSDYDTGYDFHKFLHRVVSSGSDGQDGYDWHTSASYNSITGYADGSITTTTNTSTTYTGSWIQMKLPYGLNIKKVSIDKRDGFTKANPKDAHLLGSNDDGATFYHIADITLSETGQDDLDIEIPPTSVYNLIRMVVSRNYGSVYCHIDYWSFVGDVYVIQETKIVDVSNNSVFRLDSGDGNGFVEKPPVDFANNSSTVYIFDQSHESNANNTLVIGTTFDDPTSIVSSGLTIMGTPGQPGAYTKYVSDGSPVHYFSYQTSNFGYNPTP